MTQNSDNQKAQEPEDIVEDETLDDEYWKGYWDSMREEEAVYEYYDKKHRE